MAIFFYYFQDLIAKLKGTGKKNCHQDNLMAVYVE